MPLIPLVGRGTKLGVVAANNEDFVALGLLSNVSSVNKFGRNTDIDSGVLADIWDGGKTVGALPGGSSLLWVAPTAARVHTIVSDDATDVTAAGTLTFALNAGDGDHVVINGKTYTLALAPVDIDDGEVQIGAGATNTIDNLIAAINLAGGGQYSSATTSGIPGIFAAAGAGDTMTLYSLAPVTTTEDGGDLSWGAASTVLGVGAHTLRIFGLTDWSTAEVSEDINLRGVTGVATVNSYVAIHRMRVLTKGGTNVNAGTITATAASDGTVTARIEIDQGQTQMAIYAIPSTQTALLTSLYASVNKAGGATGLVDMSLCFNPEPNVEEKMFLTKHTFGLQTVGTSAFDRHFSRPKVFPGPGILKVQVFSGTANQDISAGFDLDLVLN